MSATTAKQPAKTPPILQRAIDLFDNIADEYRAVADILRNPKGLELHEAIAVAKVMEDIAETARLSLDNLAVGNATQAERRVSEAEAVYSDMPRLIAKATEQGEEDRGMRGLRFVDLVLCGRATV